MNKIISLSLIVVLLITSIGSATAGSRESSGGIGYTPIPNTLSHGGMFGFVFLTNDVERFVYFSSMYTNSDSTPLQKARAKYMMEVIAWQDGFTVSEWNTKYVIHYNSNSTYKSI